MIDPHVDPLTDGPHVFLLGILSGAVLTFSPSDATPRTDYGPQSMKIELKPLRSSLDLEDGDWSSGGTGPLTKRHFRESELCIHITSGMRSWTDYDLDVLVRRRSVVPRLEVTTLP
eukprot:5767754-Amphidinium_carterae.1